MTIGDHLRRGRLDRGLRIVDVARTLGVTEWTVINWERGRTMPAVRFLPRVIAFLGFEPWSVGRTLEERLVAARWRTGLSQQRLARRLGLDEGTVRALEAGQPVQGRVRRIAAAFLDD